MQSSRTPLRRWLPVLIWTALIFIGSSDLLAAAHTSRFIEPLLRWLFHNHLSSDGVSKGHFLIRKTGHVTEYAILSVLIWRARYPASPSPVQDALPASAWTRRNILTTVFLAACYAGTDEFHQSFVPSRGAGFDDVLIDTFGAALGIFLLWLWQRSHTRFTAILPGDRSV